MSYFENLKIEMYNKMIYLFKSNDFYAMPKQYKIDALEIKDIKDLPKARVGFGRYDMKKDMTLLQPVKELKGGEPLFGVLNFEFPTCEFKKEIIYIDNYDIYAISRIDENDIFKLTNEHMYSQFKRDHDKIEVSYKLNFHPFNERILGK